MSSDELTGPGPPFGVTVQHVEGRVVVLLAGELDLATAPRLRDHLALFSESGQNEITLDLADLDFIDSTGLSVLVMAYTRAQASGGGMAIRNPPAAVMRIFEITGLASVFTIVTDADPVPTTGG
jgi:anti-sigma B factor antagonist